MTKSEKWCIVLSIQVIVIGIIAICAFIGRIKDIKTIDRLTTERDSLQTVLARKHFPFPDTLIYKPLQR